jgi:DNA-binding transcriptional ArsR family regulator
MPAKRHRRKPHPSGSRSTSPAVDLAARRSQARIFAALGDETRLILVAKLSANSPRSLSQLTAGSRLTRQAITKHLRVLQHAGVVISRRHGRESLYAFSPRRIAEMQKYLQHVSDQWDQALLRLKSFVEN